MAAAARICNDHVRARVSLQQAFEWAGNLFNIILPDSVSSIGSVRFSRNENTLSHTVWRVLQVAWLVCCTLQRNERDTCHRHQHNLCSMCQSVGPT